MKVTSKYKVCKRLGSSVYEKCQTQKYVIAEERAKKASFGKRRKQMSDYGKQLIEKQRIRFTYGISEKQLSGYIKEAMGTQVPSEYLVTRLESRLDNTVYRANLANTRRLARQLVSHGHVTVNGRKLTVPSYKVQIGDKIAVREGSKARTYFQNLINSKDSTESTPVWLKFNIKTLDGEVLGQPSLDNTEFNSDITEVLAFYSR